MQATGSTCSVAWRPPFRFGDPNRPVLTYRVITHVRHWRSVDDARPRRFV